MSKVRKTVLLIMIILLGVLLSFIYIKCFTHDSYFIVGEVAVSKSLAIIIPFLFILIGALWQLFDINGDDFKKKTLVADGYLLFFLMFAINIVVPRKSIYGAAFVLSLLSLLLFNVGYETKYLKKYCTLNKFFNLENKDQKFVDNIANIYSNLCLIFSLIYALTSIVFFFGVFYGELTKVIILFPGVLVLIILNVISIQRKIFYRRNLLVNGFICLLSIFFISVIIIESLV